MNRREHVEVHEEVVIVTGPRKPTPKEVRDHLLNIAVKRGQCSSFSYDLLFGGGDNVYVRQLMEGQPAWLYPSLIVEGILREVGNKILIGPCSTFHI